MNGFRIIIAIGIINGLLNSSAFALSIANPGKTDNRIKTFIYNEREVFRINAHYGYTSHITFSLDENIQYVTVGDSMAWNVVPRSNHLFLKPIEFEANTNLTVLTNKRAYNFELRASKAKSISDRSLSFAINFHYPKDEMAREMAMEIKRQKEKNSKNQFIIPEKTTSAENWNMNYTKTGSTNMAPTHVFDDGEFTYFEFPENLDTPAIFLVDEAKNESLLNYHVKGKYIVIHKVGKQFILRSGEKATCVFNESFSDENKSYLSERNKFTTHSNSTDVFSTY